MNEPIFSVLDGKIGGGGFPSQPCWEVLSSGTRTGIEAKFCNSLPLPSGSNPTATATTFWFYQQLNKVRLDIENTTQLNISVGQLIYMPRPYEWPYGEQAYWDDVVYPYILMVESVEVATQVSNGQTIKYYYTVLTSCSDVANSNTITSPTPTLTNFRIEDSVGKADFQVSATISDSKYEADPKMLFFIEYQSPGCIDWTSVFNALAPNASPSVGKPKTFTQSYTFEFQNSSNCRVVIKDGLLTVPYGGKIRVKATHGPLIFFSNEIQLPSTI
jgi:hypothetical protein